MNLPKASCTAFCLVVEDSDTDYRTLERHVCRSQIPMGLRRCILGEEVLAMLEEPVSSSGSSPGTPAVIVLDLGLAGTHDGRAVLQAVRQHPALKRTPVVVFSSSTDPADIEWCYRHGANAYQVKSVDSASFQSVAKLLSEYWNGEDRDSP